MIRGAVVGTTDGIRRDTIIKTNALVGRLALAAGALLFPRDGWSLPDWLRKARPILLAGYGGWLLVLNDAYGDQWTSLHAFNVNLARHNLHSDYALVSAGFYELGANRVAEALANCDQAERVNPDNPELHYLRAQARYAAGDKVGALASLERARALNCPRLGAEEFAPVVYFENHRFDLAAEYFTRLIDREPKANLAHLRNRAICRHHLGDFPAAIRDYDRILAADALQANAQGERGICWGRLGRREQACADLRRAVAAGLGEFTEELHEFCGPDAP